jgi:hypothetical protein
MIDRLIVALVLGLGWMTSANADVIKLNFDSVFSGTAPAGVAPWLTATFTDIGIGSVRLEIVASGLSGLESVDGVYFNLDPVRNPASLSFVRDAASTGPTAANTDIGLGLDAFRADGDGFFDILFELPPPPGSQAARFTAGESLIYQISSPGLSAAAFAFLSAPGPGGGPGPQFAAAHIQQIGGSGASGWIGASVSTVPLPGALGLLFAGLATLSAARRRRG